MVGVRKERWMISNVGNELNVDSIPPAGISMDELMMMDEET